MMMAVVASVTLAACGSTMGTTNNQRSRTRTSVVSVFRSNGGRPIVEIYAVPDGSNPRIFLRELVGNETSRLLTTGFSAPVVQSGDSGRPTDFVVEGRVEPFAWPDRAEPLQSGRSAADSPVLRGVRGRLRHTEIHHVRAPRPSPDEPM
jgi:hypothetical protein